MSAVFGVEQDWPLEPKPGDTHTDSEGRTWTCWPISYGVLGGRWAYSIPKEFWTGVVVDTRQNLQAAHFLGMLATPWDGLTKLGWVLARAHCQPVREKIEPEPQDAVRFERLERPPDET